MRARRVRTYGHGELQQLVVVKLKNLLKVETKLLDTVLTEEFFYFVVFVIVLRQCSLTFV